MTGKMATDNRSWQLEDFVDSLVVELDKTRETLAIKAVNKPLTYSVKDMALDLNIFPSYDGDTIKFITAQPGQLGASKVTIQLSSITDQQIRATTKAPDKKNDIKIEDISIDKDTKKQLRKMGVTSVSDLKQIDSSNIDIAKASDNAIDYTQLQNQIQKARRGQAPPVIRSVNFSIDENKLPYFTIKGDNLAIHPEFQPVAVVNETLADVLSHDKYEMKIAIGKQHRIDKNNQLILTFDPFAIVKLNVKA
jgi:hypothetical protein